MFNEYRIKIQEAWDDRSLLTKKDFKDAISSVIEYLDKGVLRVAEPSENGWKVNEWIKKAVIMYFIISELKVMELDPLEFHDKIPIKRGYKALGVRVVPHALARYGSYIARGVIMMPSYVNIGAYVDEGSNCFYSGVRNTTGP